MNTSSTSTETIELDFKQAVAVDSIAVRQSLELPHHCCWMRLINHHHALVGGGVSPLKVSCIDLASGNTIWTESFFSDTFSTPLYANGVIYVGIEDGNAKFSIAALDFKTGQLIWKTYISGSYNTFSNGSELVLGKGMLYFFSGASTLFAYNTDNGKVVWKLRLAKADSWVRPMLWQDRLLVQTTTRNKSALVHLNPDTGALIETVALAKGIQQGEYMNTGNPVMVGDALWYVANDNKLHDFRLSAKMECAAYPLPLKIVDKEQYDYLKAGLTFENGNFNLRAELCIMERNRCDVVFNPDTGVFINMPPMLADKKLLLEDSRYCYYSDYNLRPQFEYYITDRKTGQLLHSFALPDKSNNISGQVAITPNGTMVIFQPDYEKKTYKLLLAY